MGSGVGKAYAVKGRGTEHSHCHKGVSVYFLAHGFLNECKKSGLDRNATLYDIQLKVVTPKSKDAVCPHDNKAGSAYVDCLSGSSSGPAHVLLSVPSGSSLGHVVDTLLQYCKERRLDAKRTYAWIGTLCANHDREAELMRSGERGLPQRLQQQEQRIADIGHMVVLWSPWTTPLCCRRLWCNLELFHATRALATVADSTGLPTRISPAQMSGQSSGSLTVAMPPSEIGGFMKVLSSADTQGLGNLWLMVRGLRIQDAQMDVTEEDRGQLISYIEDQYGCEVVSRTVAQVMLRWLVETCYRHTRRALIAPGKVPDFALARMCLHVSELMLRMPSSAVFQSAAQLLQKGQALFEASGALESVEAARLLGSLGMVLVRLDRLPEALDKFALARKAREATDTLDTVEGARLLDVIGFTMWKSDNLEGTIEIFQESARIYEKLSAMESENGCRLMTFIGLAKTCTGDIQGAAEAQEKALEIRSKAAADAPESLDDAQLWAGVGLGRLQKGDVQGSLEAYGRAKQIHETLGDMESPQAIALFKNMGSAQEFAEEVRLEEAQAAKDASPGGSPLAGAADRLEVLDATDAGSKQVSPSAALNFVRPPPAPLAAVELRQQATSVPKPPSRDSGTSYRDLAPDPLSLTTHSFSLSMSHAKRLAESITNFRALMVSQMPRPPSFHPQTPPCALGWQTGEDFDRDTRPGIAEQATPMAADHLPIDDIFGGWGNQPTPRVMGSARRNQPPPVRTTPNSVAAFSDTGFRGEHDAKYGTGAYSSDRVLPDGPFLPPPPAFTIAATEVDTAVACGLPPLPGS